jgi:hypothetical protein
LINKAAFEIDNKKIEFYEIDPIRNKEQPKITSNTKGSSWQILE